MTAAPLSGGGAEIKTGLGIPLSQLSWVQTAYLMAEIVAIPLTGWLTRIMSTRGAFVACVCGFTAASLACAGSTSFWSLLAGFLAGLQLLLKEAPQRSWSAPMLLLAALCAGCAGGVVLRSLRQAMPLVDLSAFRSPNFAAGCWFSFVLGIGLYGAVYLLPLFLGLVR